MPRKREAVETEGVIGSTKITKKSKEAILRELAGEFVVDEWSENVARLLCEKEEYKDQLGHIDIDKIGFVRKNCKRKKSGKITNATCRVIRDPVKMFASKTWIITTMGENFIVLPVGVKIKVIFHELLHVSSEEGEMRDHDVQDFHYCLKTWGLDWHSDASSPLLVDVEDEKLPNVEGDDVENLDMFDQD